MRFEIRGAQVRLDFLFFALAALMLLYNAEATLIMICLSILHECGHVIALLMMGGRVKSLRLGAFGMSLVRNEDYPLNLNQEFWFVMAGPLVNLAIAGGALLIPGETALQISSMSLLLGLFNLLPVSAMDGGKALFYVMLQFMREETARRVLYWVSALLLLCLGGTSCYLLAIGRNNYSLLIVVMYLAFYLIHHPMN
ncbi:MAG: site-2 protease family protein [Clostridiales bacterium]|nr:site-2 protease family protein [Clostridiales bacterium]